MFGKLSIIIVLIEIVSIFGCGPQDNIGSSGNVTVTSEQIKDLNRSVDFYVADLSFLTDNTGVLFLINSSLLDEFDDMWLEEFNKESGDWDRIGLKDMGEGKFYGELSYDDSITEPELKLYRFCGEIKESSTVHCKDGSKYILPKNFQSGEFAQKSIDKFFAKYYNVHVYKHSPLSVTMDKLINSGKTGYFEYVASVPEVKMDVAFSPGQWYYGSTGLWRDVYWFKHFSNSEWYNMHGENKVFVNKWTGLISSQVTLNWSTGDKEPKLPAGQDEKIHFQVESRILKGEHNYEGGPYFSFKGANVPSYQYYRNFYLWNPDGNVGGMWSFYASNLASVSGKLKIIYRIKKMPKNAGSIHFLIDLFTFNPNETYRAFLEGVRKKLCYRKKKILKSSLGIIIVYKNKKNSFEGECSSDGEAISEYIGSEKKMVEFQNVNNPSGSGKCNQWYIEPGHQLLDFYFPGEVTRDFGNYFVLTIEKKSIYYTNSGKGCTSEYWDNNFGRKAEMENYNMFEAIIPKDVIVLPNKRRLSIEANGEENSGEKPFWNVYPWWFDKGPSGFKNLANLNSEIVPFSIKMTDENTGEGIYFLKGKTVNVSYTGPCHSSPDCKGGHSHEMKTNFIDPDEKKGSSKLLSTDGTLGGIALAKCSTVKNILTLLYHDVHGYIPTGIIKDKEYHFMLPLLKKFQCVIMEDGRCCADVNIDKPNLVGNITFKDESGLDGKKLYSCDYCYVAGPVAGEYTLTAKLVKPPEDPEKERYKSVRTIDVKYPDLSELTVNDLYDENKKVCIGRRVGKRKEHKRNYYINNILKPFAIDLIRRLSEQYNSTVLVNDISLPWGGKFAIFGDPNQRQKHLAHRMGTGMDLSQSFCKLGANSTMSPKDCDYPYNGKDCPNGTHRKDLDEDEVNELKYKISEKCEVIRKNLERRNSMCSTKICDFYNEGSIHVEFFIGGK